jgi:electron transfer flavoprotein alpha subunit
MTVLLLAAHDNSTFSDQTARALTAAIQIGPEVHVLVAGKDVGDVAARVAALSGVAKVLMADDDRFAHNLAEPLADLIVSIAANYEAIIAPATSVGKDVLPRVAALLDVAQISEIIQVLSPDTFKRPIYAGNAIETVQTTDKQKVVTVRSAAFSSTDEGGCASIEAITIFSGPHLSSFVENISAQSERPDLTTAKIVVSGGRALGSVEHFNQLIIPFADKLGAAVGASRAAVDAGFAPNDWQVGQTGKIVAPDIYIACGISGAIQHLAGMKDSKVIIAINKDKDAPIFGVSDFALVADIFDALPRLIEAL